MTNQELLVTLYASVAGQEFYAQAARELTALPRPGQPKLHRRIAPGDALEGHVARLLKHLAFPLRVAHTNDEERRAQLAQELQEAQRVDAVAMAEAAAALEHYAMLRELGLAPPVPALVYGPASSWLQSWGRGIRTDERLLGLPAGAVRDGARTYYAEAIPLSVMELEASLRFEAMTGLYKFNASADPAHAEQHRAEGRARRTADVSATSRRLEPKRARVTAMNLGLTNRLADAVEQVASAPVRSHVTYQNALLRELFKRESGGLPQSFWRMRVLEPQTDDEAMKAVVRLVHQMGIVKELRNQAEEPHSAAVKKRMSVWRADLEADIGRVTRELVAAWAIPNALRRIEEASPGLVQAEVRALMDFVVAAARDISLARGELPAWTPTWALETLRRGNKAVAEFQGADVLAESHVETVYRLAVAARGHLADTLLLGAAQHIGKPGLFAPLAVTPVDMEAVLAEAEAVTEPFADHYRGSTERALFVAGKMASGTSRIVADNLWITQDKASRAESLAGVPDVPTAVERKGGSKRRKKRPPQAQELATGTQLGPAAPAGPAPEAEPTDLLENVYRLTYAWVHAGDGGVGTVSEALQHRLATVMRRGELQQRMDVGGRGRVTTPNGRLSTLDEELRWTYDKGPELPDTAAAVRAGLDALGRPEPDAQARTLLATWNHLVRQQQAMLSSSSRTVRERGEELDAAITLAAHELLLHVRLQAEGAQAENPEAAQERRAALIEASDEHLAHLRIQVSVDAVDANQALQREAARLPFVQRSAKAAEKAIAHATQYEAEVLARVAEAQQREHPGMFWAADLESDATFVAMIESLRATVSDVALADHLRATAEQPAQAAVSDALNRMAATLDARTGDMIHSLVGPWALKIMLGRIRDKAPRLSPSDVSRLMDRVADAVSSLAPPVPNRGVQPSLPSSAIREQAPVIANDGVLPLATWHEVEPALRRVDEARQCLAYELLRVAAADLGMGKKLFAQFTPPRDVTLDDVRANMAQRIHGERFEAPIRRAVHLATRVQDGVEIGAAAAEWQATSKTDGTSADRPVALDMEALKPSEDPHHGEAADRALVRELVDSLVRPGTTEKDPASADGDDDDGGEDDADAADEPLPEEASGIASRYERDAALLVRQEFLHNSEREAVLARHAELARTDPERGEEHLEAGRKEVRALALEAHTLLGPLRTHVAASRAELGAVLTDAALPVPEHRLASDENAKIRHAASMQLSLSSSEISAQQPHDATEASSLWNEEISPFQVRLATLKLLHRATHQTGLAGRVRVLAEKRTAADAAELLKAWADDAEADVDNIVHELVTARGLHAAMRQVLDEAPRLGRTHTVALLKAITKDARANPYPHPELLSAEADQNRLFGPARAFLTGSRVQVVTPQQLTALMDVVDAARSAHSTNVLRQAATQCRVLDFFTFGPELPVDPGDVKATMRYIAEEHAADYHKVAAQRILKRAHQEAAAQRKPTVASDRTAPARSTMDTAALRRYHDLALHLVR